MGRKKGSKNKPKITTPKKIGKEKIIPKEIKEYQEDENILYADSGSVELEETPQKPHNRKRKSKKEVLEELGTDTTVYTETLSQNNIPHLFTINQNEIFNIIHQPQLPISNNIEQKIEVGTVFGIVIEKIENGKVYFTIKAIKG